MAPRPAEATSLWDRFRAKLLAPAGRIVDTGNAGRSHSEGQGFAMLLAVAHDDRASFEALWDWTRTTLQIRDDALLAWAWEQGPAAVVDRNNASDGDLFVAWALLRAAERWQRPSARTAAERILADLVRHCIVDRHGQRLLLPGAFGFVHADHVVLNPSYWVFPAFAAFAAAGIAGPWTELRASGLWLLDPFKDRPPGLPPDWCALGKGGIGPAPGFAYAFGFDAIRVPLYLRWALTAAAARPWLAPIAAHAAGDLGTTPAVVDLTSGATSAYPVSPGAAAILRLARQAVGDDAGGDLPGWDDRLDYYAAALLLLAHLASAEMPDAQSGMR